MPQVVSSVSSLRLAGSAGRAWPVALPSQQPRHERSRGQNEAGQLQVGVTSPVGEAPQRLVEDVARMVLRRRWTRRIAEVARNANPRLQENAIINRLQRWVGLERAELFSRQRQTKDSPECGTTPGYCCS